MTHVDHLIKFPNLYQASNTVGIMSRRIIRIDRTLLFKILSFSLSVVCILVISDVIVGHLPRKLIPHIHARRSIVYSPELGIVTNKPYSTQVVSSPWVYNTVTYNKYGFRGPDWTFPKDNGETRIAILGDSYIEGREVAFDDLITSVLEKRSGSGVRIPESIHGMLKSCRLIP